MKTTMVLGALVALSCACGGSGSSNASSPAHDGGDAAGSDGTDGGPATADGSTGTHGPGAVDQEPHGTPVELPEGSREVDGIVNLVDAQAAEELDAYITDQSLIFPTKRHGLTKCTNLFLASYLESYDFVYFVTDHPIPNTGVAAKYEPVTRPAQRGTGNDIDLAASGYRTTGRLRGVIGLQYRSGIFPPLGHETAHHWAVNLDPSFGFGTGLDGDYGAHWGFAGVHGQLGGFDAASLRCADPAGSAPPSCNALPSGRTRYVVDAFNPNDNTSAPSYGELELYLMGLLPKDDAPTSYLVLDEGQMVADSFDAQQGTVQVEAASMHEVTLSDIVAKHGEVSLLDDEARRYKAAFVVISKEPAPDALLAEVARWAKVFGGREKAEGLPSFASLTGERADMDTRLGARRGSDDALPPPRAAYTCDVLRQDCAPGLVCHLDAPSYCVLSGGVKENEPCAAQFACAKGLDCVAGSRPPTTSSASPIAMRAMPRPTRPARSSAQARRSSCRMPRAHASARSAFLLHDRSERARCGETWMLNEWWPESFRAPCNNAAVIGPAASLDPKAAT